jgi:hypothetical protein
MESTTYRRRWQRGQRAWGKPQPSCFTFISSSGPVLAPIQMDQSGDKNLCDNNQKIVVAPYNINQPLITILKIVIVILIDRVRGGVYLQPTESGQRGQRAWGKPQPFRFAFISSSGPVLALIQRISQAIKICTITISGIIVVPYDINQSSITILKIVIAILIDRITLSKFLLMISR